MTANLKAICLCVFLFFASAFVSLSLRTSHHSSQFFPKPGNGVNPLNQRPIHGPKVAYATFLAGRAGVEEEDDSHLSPAAQLARDEQDGYFLSTRVLAYQLLHSQSAGTNHSIPFLVVCTRDVSKRKRDRLKKDGAQIVLVEKLASEWVQPAVERWADVLAKLRLFQLVEWSKICFIDADTMVTASLDGVFFDEATLTQATLSNPAGVMADEAELPRTYMFSTHAEYYNYDHGYPPPVNINYLNSGFFVFSPSLALFNYYMSLLKLPGRFNPGFPEQNLLNYAHRRDANMPWTQLWYGWNVNWPTANDWRGGAKSFHAKYWDGDPSHDPVLKAMWKEQRAEMSGFYRGKELGLGH